MPRLYLKYTKVWRVIQWSSKNTERMNVVYKEFIKSKEKMNEWNMQTIFEDIQINQQQWLWESFLEK